MGKIRLAVLWGIAILWLTACSGSRQAKVLVKLVVEGGSPVHVQTFVAEVGTSTIPAQHECRCRADTGTDEYILRFWNEKPGWLNFRLYKDQLFQESLPLMRGGTRLDRKTALTIDLSKKNMFEVAILHDEKAFLAGSRPLVCSPPRSIRRSDRL